MNTVKVAIHDNTANTDYNGTSFGGGGQQFLTPAGTTAWSYALAAAKLTDGHSYTVTVETIDNIGNTDPNASSRTFTYDTTAPTVANVTASNANGAFNAGQTIQVQVDFSEPVDVTGTPQLALNTTPAESAAYASGSGTPTLVFDYIVQAGDNAATLDYAAANALTLNGGTIADPAGNDATLHAGRTGRARLALRQQEPDDRHHRPDRRQRDGVERERLVQGRPDDRRPGRLLRARQRHRHAEARAEHQPGRVRRLRLRHAAPRRSSSTTRSSPATTSPTSTTPHQRAHPQRRHHRRPGGQRRHADARRPGHRRLPRREQEHHRRHHRPDGQQRHRLEPERLLQRRPDHPRPGRLLRARHRHRHPAARAEHRRERPRTSPARGSSTLVFDYTIQAGDTSADLDYHDAAALTLNGGTIRDAATNNATLGLAAPGASNSLGANKDIVVDTTAPTVTSVSAFNGSGSFDAGQTIHVQVNFSEPVNVTGTPQLALNTSPAESAHYVSGGGTTTLVFDYTVQAGDTADPLDYAATSSLTLSGGTIRDAATNDATLTLAAPGATGSLSANKTLVIDTVAPTVTSRTANGATLDVTYSEPLDSGSSPAAGDFTVNVNGSADAVDAVTFAGGNTIVRLTLHTPSSTSTRSPPPTPAPPSRIRPTTRSRRTAPRPSRT